MCCYHQLCADMISFFIIRKCLKIRYLTKIVKLRKNTSNHLTDLMNFKECSG